LAPAAKTSDLFNPMTADRKCSATSPQIGAAGLRGLEQGDRVSYSVEIDQKNGKPRAANLKLI
jgi:cold shock CspA family protein